jgi:cytochrome P450
MGQSSAVSEDLTPSSLNELPGPKGIPAFGNLFQLDRNRLHLQLQDWCTVHGSVYRFKMAYKSCVVVSDMTLIHDILRRRPNDFRRMSAIDDAMQGSVRSGLFSAEGAVWKRQRKLTAPAFHQVHLKQFFPILSHIIQRLRRRFQKRAYSGQDFEIGKDLMRFTVDVTTQLAFAYDINTLEKDGDLIQKYLEVVFPTLGRRINSPFPYWHYFKLPGDWAFDRALVKIREKLDTIVFQCREQLRQKPESAKDASHLLEILLSTVDDEGSHLTEDEIFANVFTILLAGEDTTSNSIAWMMYFMLNHPEVQTKMQEEADRVLGKSEQLEEFEAIDKLNYIEAVALESMRLKPVAPLLFLETNQDILLNKLKIPKGTNLIALLSHEALQEENFSSATEFRPERWLPEQRPPGWQHNPKMFIPFGGGVRICPGKSLAMLEIKAAMAMFCKNFQVQLPSNSKTAVEDFNFVNSPRDLWTRIENR